MPKRSTTSDGSEPPRGDLVKKTEAELLSYKNFGETSLMEIKEILKNKGLRLGMGHEDLMTTPLGEPARTTPEGYEALFRIKCTTCHDNHRWSVLPREEAGMIPNTVLTSFLRGEDLAKTLCSNCHGAQALYLYRFYHQERAFRVRIPNR